MAPAPVLRFDGSREFNQMPQDLRARTMGDWIEESIYPLLAKLTPERRHSMGQDFARSGDLSVIAPMSIEANLDRVVPFLVEMHNVPFKQQEQVLFAIGDGLPRLCGVAIDSRGNGSYIGEAAHDKWGSIVDRVMPTENWYREQMPRYKARFEDRTILVPQDDGVLEDHRAFTLVRGVARLPEGKTSRDGKRHGDAAMACVLAHHASEMDAVEIDFRSTGVRRAGYEPGTIDKDVGWGVVGGSLGAGGF